MRRYFFRTTVAPTGPSAGLVPDWLPVAPGIDAGRLLDDDQVELADGRRLATSDLRPAPAVSAPGKIICIGFNYRDHVAEQSQPLPDRPILFAKFANAIVADGEPVVRPPGTHALDLEAELGVVIRRRAKAVAAAEAMAYVGGYVVCNDITARDWQGNRAALRPGERGDGQWLRAKGSDTFLPVGPVFVDAEDITDPHDLAVRSWRVPGSGPDAGREVPMQDGSTRDMIFSIPELIAFISAVITLEPGDLIVTGTPAGVGVFRDPPIFLEPGDRVRVSVEGVGTVANPIVAGDPSTEQHRTEGRRVEP
ncbi:MAG TPA: fumarylacetoacetate hydrolase family protein [Candidatus Binatia bacterium]|nr:fumarylacetoacetate hydrolase family protein [Candidatus Binatia bacterium]